MQKMRGWFYIKGWIPSRRFENDIQRVWTNFTADSINSQLYSSRLISIPSSGYSRFAAPLFRPCSSRILINPGIINPTRATWQFWSIYFCENNWKSWKDRFFSHGDSPRSFPPLRRKEDDWLIDKLHRLFQYLWFLQEFQCFSIFF